MYIDRNKNYKNWVLGYSKIKKLGKWRESNKGIWEGALRKVWEQKEGVILASGKNKCHKENVGDSIKFR